VEKGKKLIKHGNSWALILDKALLNALSIDPETSKVEILIKDGQFIIKPVASAKEAKTREDELDEIAQRIMEKYDSVFKNLLKN